MQQVTPTQIWKYHGNQAGCQDDHLATEEPLEIRLGFARDGVRQQKSVSVTMRTPGHDAELALGFLLSEGILSSTDQVQDLYTPAVRHGNVLTVELTADAAVEFKRLERHFYTSSSCGVCGKASIEAVRVPGQHELPPGRPRVSASLLHRLPSCLRQKQAVFGTTGGLHAAGLFDPQGNLLLVREDVGRHNALDKLIGAAANRGWLPLQNHLVLLSGRVGFEMVQKTVVAGAPLLAAVGAPTSLAVSLADEAGLTLVGFLRRGQFNVYTCPERVQG